MRGRAIGVLLATLGVTACNLPTPASMYKKHFEKQDLANEVRNNVAKQLKEELGLSPCGTMGQMLNEIQILGLSFFYYQPVDIIKGRKLLVQAVETMRKEINKREDIRPYLVRYPFAPRNVQIQIFLYNSGGKDVNPGALCVIEVSEGILSYETHDPETKKLTTIYQETYEEALERLADPSLPLVPFNLSDSKISEEEMAKLCKGILFVDKDGVIWHLDKSGTWIQDQRSK